MVMADQENAFEEISVKNMDKLIIQLESVLFLKGEPVNINWLAKTLDKPEKEINISLERLSKQLENRESGLSETATMSSWRPLRNQPKF